MSRATPQAQQIAGRIIAAEMQKRSRAGADLPAAFYVCEMLRPHFATLMGNAGFRAILSRALTLAGAEAPWLSALNVEADGSLAGWEKPEARVNPERLRQSSALLVAELLGLLIAFIGDRLTLRLVGEVWPELSLSDPQASSGDPP